MPVRRRLRVTGRVQGVFYRAWFGERARALGLAGWVRNRADGSVEAVIEGEDAAVTEMIDLARSGSPASRVADVAIGEEPANPPLASFTTRATL